MPQTFTAVLFTVPGKGGWTFAPIPEQHAPAVAGPWGRTPVVATVDGVTWSTSAWLDSKRGWLLPVPKNRRRGKGHGDVVEVSIAEPEQV